MGNIFIRRPIFAMVIAIMIVVLGLIGIQNTPIEQYPDITPPMVQVSADYQGADALTVEQSIATPIEESVNGVSDMLYMQSTNSNDGSMSLQVTFGVGSNPDMNTNIYTKPCSVGYPPASCGSHHTGGNDAEDHDQLHHGTVAFFRRRPLR